MSQKIEETAVTVRQQAQVEIAEMIANLDWQEIRNNYAPGATDTEFALFCDACKANGLDPRKREAYFVKYGNSKGQIITGYQTYLKRAELSGKLNGWDVKLTKAGGKPTEAVLTIYRKDWEKPFVWSVDADEFNKQQSTWSAMPGFMLKKVAIAQGFRIAFPDELGGLPYTNEEVASFSDEGTSKAVMESTRSRTIDMTPEPAPKPKVKAKAQKSEPKPEPEPEPEPKPKPEPEAKEPPTQEQEPSTPPTANADLLDEATANTIIATFDTFGVTQKLLVGVLGAQKEEWTSSHREWLLERYHELDDGSLDAKKFAALSYE